MSTRQGGKQKPLKAPKKDGKELDDDDVAFQNKQKENAKAEAALVAQLKTKGGVLASAGLKKSK